MSCRKVTTFIVGNIERGFQRHGERIGQHPWRHLAVAVFIVSLSLIGFLRFRQEKHPLRLWVPQESDYLRDTNWLIDNYGEGVRMQFVLITADDVLEPRILNQLLNIHIELNNMISTPSWKDVCFKVPKISFNMDSDTDTDSFYRSRRQSLNWGHRNSLSNTTLSGNVFSVEDSLQTVESDRKTKIIQQMMTNESYDPSQFLGEMYCNIVNKFEKGCLQHSLLDVWKYDPAVIQSLKKSDILRKLNSTIISPTLGHPMDFTSLLGGVELNKEGVISSAKALLSLWMVHVNFSTVDMDQVGNDGGTADWANGPGLEWEKKFLEVMENVSRSAVNMKLFYEAGRSFGDISATGMFQDMDKLLLGVLLMLAYVQFHQTRNSCVESRIMPCAVGLLCVGLAFVASCGLCSMCGIPYGPVHTSLPFLMLGIGVDDMFVILNCWNELPKEQRISSLPRRFGVAMRHAGLSITITSATDFVAFAVGSSTILPSLQSFCIYAAVGVLLTYFLQVSVFVAILVLDQKRLEAGRNFLLPCVIHTTPDLTDIKTSSLHAIFSSVYSRAVLKKFGKGFVLLLTLIFLSFGVWGNFKLKQEFDPEWFLDEKSYLFQFLQKRNEYFPDFGNSASVYFGRLKYNEELPKIGKLALQLTNHSTILKNFDNWFMGFHRYVNTQFSRDIKTEILSDADFKLFISKYLFSPSGSRYQKNFKFSEPLECGNPAPNITVASFDFVFRQFKESKDRIAAMNLVKLIVKNANFTSGDKFATVWAKVFANWVTDEVIAGELYRNLVLAVLCVGGTTAVFLANLVMSSWVLLCVLLTLVDVSGFMYFWGLTIDLVSCIALVLAVGLCVDFAAHIGYAYLSCRGSRQHRSLTSVVYIGGAVLHGGVTTLLALSVLVLSNSYIFKAFFKIFLLVILLGLFHGIIFLPVILSLVGPAPYSTSCDQEGNELKGVNNLPNQPEESGLSGIDDFEPEAIETSNIASDNAE